MIPRKPQFVIVQLPFMALHGLMYRVVREYGQVTCLVPYSTVVTPVEERKRDIDQEDRHYA